MHVGACSSVCCSTSMCCSVCCTERVAVFDSTTWGCVAVCVTLAVSVAVCVVVCCSVCVALCVARSALQVTSATWIVHGCSYFAHMSCNCCIHGASGICGIRESCLPSECMMSHTVALTATHTAPHTVKHMQVHHTL